MPRRLRPRKGEFRRSGVPAGVSRPDGARLAREGSGFPLLVAELHFGLRARDRGFFVSNAVFPLIQGACTSRVPAGVAGTDLALSEEA